MFSKQARAAFASAKVAARATVPPRRETFTVSTAGSPAETAARPNVSFVASE